MVPVLLGGWSTTAFGQTLRSTESVMLSLILTVEHSTRKLFFILPHTHNTHTQQHANKYEDNEEAPPVEKCILVGHNGKVFDIPFLIHQLSEHGIADRLFQDGRFGLGIDTLNVARRGICNDKSGIGVPSAYNFHPTLYQFVTGLLPSTWHCAMADVKATTATIFHFPIFGTQDTNVF
jgi:hypothetical protein